MGAAGRQLSAATRPESSRTSPLPQLEPVYGYVSLAEVQRAQELLRAIKLPVDNDRRPDRFLYAGSANLPLLPRLGDSLAGRFYSWVPGALIRHY